MNANVKPKNAAQLEALLEFYVANGVDCTLDDIVHDRFEDTESARTAHEEKVQSAVLPMKSAKNTKNIAPPKSQTIPVTPSQSIPDAATLQSAREIATNAPDLDALKEALQNFDGCNLKRTAKNLVFGDGNPDARVMFVGEAPGRDEDIGGVPFVGRSGELLNKMLAAIDLDREEDVYIANIVPWRPPGNRAPTPQETELCRPFIERQISLVNPEILVLLGGAAAKQLLQTSDGIMRLRGKFKTMTLPDREIEAIAMLHPAYLLRQPGQKRLAWQDLLKIRARLG